MANSITTGNIVVPLQAILDQLQGKLSTADLNSLTTSLIGARSPTVKAGDLITADFMNSILSEIAQIDVRVTNLESATSTTTPTQITLIRIDGTLPIRVGDRVTAVGSGFSVPGSRNGLSVDSVAASTVDTLSSATALVFNVPDPGLSGVGRTVTLSVTNADSQTATLTFNLQPALQIPSGNLALNYMTAPGGGTVTAGTYDFTFKLTADVDQNALAQINAQSSAADWPVTLIDPNSGSALTNPVTLSRALGTHFEYTFIARLTVPGGGSTSTTLTLGATELTTGTHVNPAPSLVYALSINGAIPTPESRVAISLLGSGSNVTLNGGTVVFKSGVLGTIAFGVSAKGLGVPAGVVTSFALSVKLGDGDATSWQNGPLSQAQLTATGDAGSGNTTVQVQPPSKTSATALYFTITGTPSVGSAVNATFRVPLSVN